MAGQSQQRAIFIASFLTLIAAGMVFAIRTKVLADWSAQFGFTKGELGTITGGGLTGFGITIIVRALLAPMSGSAPACVRCGEDARALVDFICPTCRHDVRDAGLFAAPLDSPFARFWRA